MLINKWKYNAILGWYFQTKCLNKEKNDIFFKVKGFAKIKVGSYNGINSTLLSLVDFSTKKMSKDKCFK